MLSLLSKNQRQGISRRNVKIIQNWNYRNCHCGIVLLYACACRFARRSGPVGYCRISRYCPIASIGDFHWHNNLCCLETKEKGREMTAVFQSIITCPKCAHSETETMPTDACQWFYDCTACGVLLKPKQGDCCVYCSYGSVACPPIQEGGQKGDACCS